MAKTFSSVTQFLNLVSSLWRCRRKISRRRWNVFRFRVKERALQQLSVTRDSTTCFPYSRVKFRWTSITSTWGEGLCNNYLDWEIGEICSKLSHTPLSLHKKLISTLPHIMISLKLTSPRSDRSLLPLIPSYLVYFLDFFLRYKHHFKQTLRKSFFFIE